MAFERFAAGDGAPLVKSKLNALVDWANGLLETDNPFSLVIDDLDDVTITTPSTNHILKYSGGVWVNEAMIASPTAGNLVSQNADGSITDAGIAVAHAAEHKHGGSDEVATATPAANAIPKADGTGKLASGWLPSIGVVSVDTVASEAAQLALTSEEGDLAIRTDLSKTYAHNGGSAGTMADWTELIASGGSGTMSSYDIAPDTGDVMTVEDGDTVNVIGGSVAVETTGTDASTTLEIDLVLATDGGLEVVDDAYGTGLQVKDGVRYAMLSAIFDNDGSDIAAAKQADIYVPFAGTIVEAVLLNDAAGSIVIDVWKDTYASYPPTNADSITAAAPLTTSSAIKAKDTTLTGWTVSVAAGDTIRLNVDSCTGVTRCFVGLVVDRG